MSFIAKKSIEEVESRVQISDIVSKFVTLKNAGMDREKGLCPFHNEKTPSFTVSNSRGTFKCFGCQESGNIFVFIQKQMGMNFKDSVEYIASQAGITLQYEQSTNTDYSEKSKIWGDKNETLEIYKMNEFAMEHYKKNLFLKEAKLAVDLIKQRNFTGQTAVDYSLGYSLNSWDTLVRHLATKGWTTDQIVASGLGFVNKNGNINDFFRNRLMFPISDLSGRVVGFGARQLEEDEKFKSGKFVNTGLTKVYTKSKILYGIDRARKDIALKKQAIIVEGYMDVMAMNLSGFQEAVAPCGTAFTNDQLLILRRLLGGENEYEGKIIFVFDGDNAGLEAAQKAFNISIDFVSCCYVAVPENGMDPCDLRLKYGKTGIEELLNNKVPILEFILKKNIAKFDTTILEGKNLAIKETNKILEKIKDDFLKDEYKKKVSSWLKIEDKYINSIALNDSNPSTLTDMKAQPSEFSKYIKTTRDKLESDLISVILKMEYLKANFDENLILNPALKQIYSKFQNCQSVIKTIEELPRAKAFIFELTKIPSNQMTNEELDLYIKDISEQIQKYNIDRNRQILKQELERTDPNSPRYKEILEKLELYSK